MKKRILVIVGLLLMLLPLLCACEREHTVTFVFSDGRPSVTVEVADASELYEPAPLGSGEVFAGWFLDRELTKPYLSGAITEDMTLYARFLPKGERAVTFVYNNGAQDTSILISGTLTEPSAPTRAGYIFLGWTDAARDDGEPYAFGGVPTEAHTVLVAMWREASLGVTLTVHPENGEESVEIPYAYSEYPLPPAAPEGDGLDFMGWYSDPECTELFDFEKPLTADTHIYAGWDVDMAAIGNRIALEVLPSTVKIHASRTSGALISLSRGSGVVYAKHDGYYYVLTNRHVVAPESGYASTTYKIYDAYGNEYVGQRQAMSEDCDLAVLRFEERADQPLPVALFASGDPAVGSTLISVGNPGNLTNCVTYGVLTKYDTVDLSGSVTGQEVGWHDTPIDNGSSGGGVFNADGELVGINFAAATDSGGGFVCGAFVQRSLVVRFLTECNMVFD